MDELRKILEKRSNIVISPTIKLKMELQKEDYKIIKCMEYQLLGKKLPYDIKNLHEKRNKIREEINKEREG